MKRQWAACSGCTTAKQQAQDANLASDSRIPVPPNTGHQAHYVLPARRANRMCASKPLHPQTWCVIKCLHAWDRLTRSASHLWARKEALFSVESKSWVVSFAFMSTNSLLWGPEPSTYDWILLHSFLWKGLDLQGLGIFLNTRSPHFIPSTCFWSIGFVISEEN